MSTLFVNNIKHTNDTSAMTIDTSGRILTPARPFFRVGYISIIGVAVSAYHIFLQNGGGGGGTCAVDVPCDMKYVDIFGFISIPVMAGTGFLTIFVALLYYDFARKELVE